MDTFYYIYFISVIIILFVFFIVSRKKKTKDTKAAFILSLIGTLISLTAFLWQLFTEQNPSHILYLFIWPVICLILCIKMKKGKKKKKQEE